MRNWHAEYVRDVIDSCITLEQLMVAQGWIRNIWKDEELIMFADKRIEQRERELGETYAGDQTNIGFKRIH